MAGFDNEVLFATNVDFRNVTPVVGQITADGQLLIGATAAPNIRAGSLTSSDSSITVTPGAGTISLTVAGGTTVGKTITGNSGGALSPTAGNWNIVGTGSTTASGAASTLTVELTGLTDHNVLIGAGTTTITKVAPSATSGVALVSQGAAADPAFDTVVVAGGGTGAITLTGVLTGNGTSAVTANAVTQHAVLIAGASNAVSSITVGTNGQVLIGATTADPAFATLTSSDSSISFTTGANTLSLQVAGGSTTVKTLSDDVASVVTPASGNIQLVGHVVEQGATKFSTVTAGTNLLNINPMSASRWIVDPLGFNGTHTTIQAAITAATSGDTVFIMDGTYTENLTLKAGVNLTSYASSADGEVTIIGKATFTAAGIVDIAGLSLQTNSDFFLAVTGSAASTVNLITCFLNCTNNTGISFTSSNAAAVIAIRRCNGDLGTTGIAFHSMSSAGTLSYRYSNFLNSGASTTSSSNSAGTVSKQYCRFTSPVSTSSTGVIEKLYVYADTSATNTTCLTTAGTGTSTVRYCDFKSGTVSALSIGTGTTLNVYNAIINSSNTNAITGLGTINYSNIDYVGTSFTMNTSGQVPSVIVNNAIVVVTPGAYPYTTASQDELILVDTTSARTIIPHSSPKKGQKYRIKDSVGSAATNNITITPSAHNIDGQASLVVKSNYGSVDIVYNGSEWSLL